MLEKVVEVGLLFDFYGSLLTERQQQIIELYYSQDLSLGEIAGRLDITRQGVYDHLQRGEEALYEYEGKLGLVSRFNNLRMDINRLEEYIRKQEIGKKLRIELLNKMENIKDSL